MAEDGTGCSEGHCSLDKARNCGYRADLVMRGNRFMRHTFLKMLYKENKIKTRIARPRSAYIIIQHDMSRVAEERWCGNI